MKTLRNPADKEEILRRIERVEPDSLRLWGSMSAHNMICHLSDGFRLYMGERPAKPVAMRVPRKFLKWVALWAPMPWPKGFQTFPELDQQAGGTRPAEFARDKKELVELLERFTQTPGRFGDLHPHFGRLSPDEWLRLAYLHADHHLRQFGT